MNKTMIAKLAASTLVTGTVMLGGGMAGMAKAPIVADGKAASLPTPRRTRPRRWPSKRSTRRSALPKPPSNGSRAMRTIACCWARPT